MFLMMNYLKFKQINLDQIQESLSKAFKIGRDKGVTLYVLSHMFEKNGKVWFKGIICLPNQLLQTAYWCEQVLPGKGIILDFTDNLTVPVLKGGIHFITNPDRVIFGQNFKSYVD